MRFGSSPPYAALVDAIREALSPHGISAVRADEKEYHQDLSSNVLTYLHGAGFGVSVFERIETEAHNPNVAFEVGYLFALNKPVCLLKDRTVPILPSDLVGKLYRTFDPYDIQGTIPPTLNAWLVERGLLQAPRPFIPKEVLDPLLYSNADYSNWTPELFDQFFRNAKRDSTDAARFNNSYVAMREALTTELQEGRQILLRVIATYGLRDRFDEWEREQEQSSGQ
jgi:hypothetical protein